MGKRLGEHRVLLRVVARRIVHAHDAFAVPRPVVVRLRGDSHKVRPEEQERRNQVHLNEHRHDDRPLREHGLVAQVYPEDERLGPEQENQEEHEEHDRHAQAIERERLGRVDGNALKAHGEARPIVYELDAQVAHGARRAQVHIHAFGGHGGNRGIGHARRVIRVVEVREVRFVGEHDVEVEQLRRLFLVEREVDVVNGNVEVLELHRVVELRESVVALVVHAQVEPVAQVDFLVAERAVEVDVEERQLEHDRHAKHDERTLERPSDGAVVRIQHGAHLIEYVSLLVVHLQNYSALARLSCCPPSAENGNRLASEGG